MKVAAVVVTYNRKELLTENIQSLLAQETEAELDILVIDNASTDGTYEYISEYVESNKVIYKNTGANLGGAGGFNFGIKYAAENDYDYVWIMDDDCMPTESALQEFIIADQELNSNYGYLSSKVLWKDGNTCKMNIQRKTVTKPLKDFSANYTRIAMASFVSLFIPTKVVKELGLPIKEFFIWTDDWEYTRRISLKYKCYYISESVAVHKSVSNIGANIATDSVERIERYKYLYRNDVYLYRREGFVGFSYEIIRLATHVCRVIFKAKNNKRQRISCIFEGTKNGFKFKPEIEYVR